MKKETNDRSFIDTNILVYAKLVNSDVEKHQTAKEFLNGLSGKIFLSTQVLNEYYTVLLRNKVEDIIIQDSVKSILNEVILETIQLNTILLSWEIRNNYKYSYYDCLIVASALLANCRILYTEDTQHNQLINSKLKILNPFISVSDKLK